MMAQHTFEGLQIKFRTFNKDESLGSIFGITLTDTSNKLSNKIITNELLDIIKVNQSQEGYDILAYPVISNTNTNEILTCYINVKLGVVSNDTQYNLSVNACADSFVKTMKVHLKNHPNSTVDDMSNVYFIIYNWALDINIGNHTQIDNHENYQTNLRYRLLQYINAYMSEINNNNNTLSNDTINLFIDKYFDSNIFIVTKYEMNDWLLPSIIPLGDLFSNIVKSDIELPIV